MSYGTPVGLVVDGIPDDGAAGFEFEPLRLEPVPPIGVEGVPTSGGVVDGG